MKYTGLLTSFSGSPSPVVPASEEESIDLYALADDGGVNVFPRYNKVIRMEKQYPFICANAGPQKNSSKTLAREELVFATLRLS